MEMSVYCIIVTYNAMKWVDRCLTSLRESTILVNTVVVDNLSTDNTVSYINDKYPEVCIIHNSENKGFGQANNQGIEYAYSKGATHFFLLNQDAWVSKDGIEQLVSIQNRYNIAILSPIHLNGTAEKFDNAYLSAAVFEDSNVEFVNNLFFSNLKDYYIVEKINAAAWMISRETIESIGGFNPLFFHYGEDINYCQRLKYFGKVIAFTPKATICHDRNEHGNMAVYNKRAILTFLLTRHSNINHPFFSTQEKIPQFTILLYWRIIKCFLGLRWNNLGLLCGSYAQYIFKIPAIFRSRKQDKKTGHNWLKL